MCALHVKLHSEIRFTAVHFVERITTVQSMVKKPLYHGEQEVTKRRDRRERTESSSDDSSTDLDDKEQAKIVSKHVGCADVAICISSNGKDSKKDKHKEREDKHKEREDKHRKHRRGSKGKKDRKEKKHKRLS